MKGVFVCFVSRRIPFSFFGMRRMFRWFQFFYTFQVASSYLFAISVRDVILLCVQWGLLTDIARDFFLIA